MKGYGIVLCLALGGALLLAGCGGNDEIGVGKDGAGGPGGSYDSMEQAPAHRFSDNTEATQIVEDGTFEGNDHCWLADQYCETLNPGYIREFDITDQIEPGVPTHVDLTVEYDVDDLALGSGYNTSIATDGVHIASQHHDIEQGHHQIQTRLVRDETSTVKVVLKAYGFDQASATDWTLTMELQGAIERVEHSVPVLVPMSSGTTGFNVTSQGPGEAEFILWGAGDEVVASNSTTDGHFSYTASGGHQGKDHVLLVRPGSSSVQVNATGPEPSGQQLRALVPQWAPVGEMTQLTHGDSESWSFDLETLPLSVGLVLQSEESTLNGEVNATITNPRGTLLETVQGCTGCIGFELIDDPWEHREHAPYGDTLLQAGTYEVDVDFTALPWAEVLSPDAQIEAQAYKIVFER